MKIYSLLEALGCAGVAFALLVAAPMTGQAKASDEGNGPLTAAAPAKALAGLVGRVTPEYAGRVRFILDATKQSSDISADEGRNGILITAPSVRECARAYVYYLRHLAHVHLSWNGDNRTAAQFMIPEQPVSVPATLPMNFAFNYCTLSYTGAHWSQKRWLKEIDRLALNGFRYVLVTSGLEKVWQGFLSDIGAKSSASSFIANPCYSAW